eukprot:6884658-Prymnesium_polylepis.1
MGRDPWKPPETARNRQGSQPQPASQGWRSPSHHPVTFRVLDCPLTRSFCSYELVPGFRRRTSQTMLDKKRERERRG